MIGRWDVYVLHLNISLSFSVYRTELLSEAFHCREWNRWATLILRCSRVMYVPHLNISLSFSVYNRTTKWVFPLQKSNYVYGTKFTDILRNEEKINFIFSKYHLEKAKSLNAYEFNVQHSDHYTESDSVTSKRRSIDGPFSRQVRQKSSGIDMPESSQNGMAFDNAAFSRALKELADAEGVNQMTYSIASLILKEPEALSAYSYLPTLEKKVEYLLFTWRLRHDPKSVLRVSCCFVFCLFISYTIINSFRFSTAISVIYTYCSFNGILGRTSHQPASVRRGA